MDPQVAVRVTQDECNIGMAMAPCPITAGSVTSNHTHGFNFEESPRRREMVLYGAGSCKV